MSREKLLYRVKLFRGIRMKLISSFLIPVSLIIILGIISYNKASKGLFESYEQATDQSVQKTGDYFELSFNLINAGSMQLSSNNDLIQYYTGSEQGKEVAEYKLFKSIYQNVMSKVTSDKLVHAIHLFSNYGKAISSCGTLPKDTYQQFLNSSEYKEFENGSKEFIWCGSHQFLEQLLGTSTEEYGISLIRCFYNHYNKPLGYVVIDVDTNEIKSVLEELNSVEGAITGFLTQDKREILVGDIGDKQTLFTDADFYQKTANSGQYITYNNQEYLFTFYQIEESGATICNLIPKSIILQQAYDIRLATVFVVIIGCFIAILTGVYLAASFSKAIKRIMHLLHKVSQGDLTTVEVKSKRKDEFKILANSIKDMLINMRDLISKVVNTSNQLSSSAINVESNSGILLSSTKEITEAIHGIEVGIIQQSTDADSCLKQMADLAEKINLVSHNTEEIKDIAQNAKETVGGGITIIDDLNSKAKETTKVTHIVIKNIKQLEDKSKSIGTIITTIKDIADQTNLLSLNASIEAARAGESGKGFAVVASEIKKLADQSIESVAQIQKIIEEIQSQTKGTAESAKTAENMVSSQTQALEKTVEVFQNINLQVERLTNNLDKISTNVVSMEDAKESTLEAIKNISSVSEQNAAATEEVDATSNTELDAVQSLYESASGLGQEAKNLEEAIQIFKI